MIPQFSKLHSKSARRRVFGVLAIFWLNLAAMPCTMAIEAESDYSHCPSMPAQAMVQIDHDAIQVEADCLALQADCCSSFPVTADKRASAEKVQKDTIVVAAEPAAWPDLDTPRIRIHDPEPPDPDVCFPPLHVLNCVYLD